MQAFQDRYVIVYIGIYSKVGIFVVSENILFLIASSQKIDWFFYPPQKVIDLN